MKPQDSTGPGQLPPAQAVATAGLVSYQPGAIVSRELVTRAQGRVVLFAFDAGQGLSEHTSPFEALVHGVEGAAEITVAGQPVRVAEGDLLLMPAGQPHALKALTRFKMILTLLRD